MSERWDCHLHKDELRVGCENTIYHPEKGQLCYGVREAYGWLFYPIRFKDKAAAYKWIKEGCIAEIQEGLTCLQVGFRTECFKPLERPYETSLD